MPPALGKSKSKTGRDTRRSRSRNTTPISSTSVAQQSIEPDATSPSTMDPVVNVLRTQSNISIENILNKGSHNAAIPCPDDIHNMLSDVQKRFLPELTGRTQACERIERDTHRRLNSLSQDPECAGRDAEERSLRPNGRKRGPADGRPLAVGAHGVARQDGTGAKDTSTTASSQSNPCAMGRDNADKSESPCGSESARQPSKAPTVPTYQTFGPDPTKFNDPTIYHIRDITEDTPEELKKEILGVAEYPNSDLKDLTPGTPPDQDFSNAKPQTQVGAGVFANHVEPYLRPLTEEDLAFLKERPDRVVPFHMPRRGPRHYKDIWDDEDGGMIVDQPIERLPPNEARGSMDMMNDEIAETDAISPGPLVSRLLAALRPEVRNSSSESNGATTNGDMDMDGECGDLQAVSQQYAPWRDAAVGRPDYVTMDERAMQELIHVGFTSPDDKPDYDGHFDDEVAARLRYLQDELQKQSIINGARKARLLHLAQGRMAQQEYSAIEDDLNNQLNAAYLKRNRNLSKSKKNSKRPGGPGGGSHAVVQVGAGSSRGLGDEIRMLMDKKERWTSIIGPVVDYGKASIPRETIFDDETMQKYMEKEREGWAEVEE